MAKPRAIKLHELNTLGGNSQEILNKIVGGEVPETKVTQVENIIHSLFEELYKGVEYSSTVRITENHEVRVNVIVPTYNAGFLSVYPVDTDNEEIRKDIRSKLVEYKDRVLAEV